MKRAHIAKSVIGYLAFDDNQKLLSYKLFKLSPEYVAEMMKKDFDRDFLDGLKDYVIEEDEFAKAITRKNIRRLAIDLGFVKKEEDFNRFLSELGIIMSKGEMNIEKDKVVIQVSNALMNLNKSLNSMIEHFKEIYWLHYPELKMENEEMINSVKKYGTRENFPDFKKSCGIIFDKKDEKIVKQFAEQLDGLIMLKKLLESYIEDVMKEIAPNFSYLVGEKIASRLLALAGSLEKLAKMASSTIQLLGSEKALFRHLRNKKAKPPKYGILYECSYVKNAPIEHKGKIARIVASKLSVAAKIDYYSKRDERKRLKEELEKEIERVMQ
ncbi:MAG: hypothetical protein QXQ40_00240 [Candidatus Aenigmatarchaeota archaeon]